MVKGATNHSFCAITILALLLLFSYVYMTGTALSEDRSREGLMILIWTDSGKYLAGEDINFSIAVKNQNELPVDISTLQYQVVYTSLNVPVLKGDLAWQRKIKSGDTYYSSKAFFLPDYVPPGRYRITANLISDRGTTLGSADLEVTIEANYLGIARGVSIFLLYVLAVTALFAIIFYYRYSEVEKG